MREEEIHRDIERVPEETTGGTPAGPTAGTEGRSPRVHAIGSMRILAHLGALRRICPARWTRVFDPAVDASALRALKRQLLARVGELAAGWNAGAQKLGVKLPAQSLNYNFITIA